MTTLTHRTGNLFDAAPGVALGQGVNTHGLMGAGIARQFRFDYPQMYFAYSEACTAGTLRPGGVFPWHPDDGTRTIMNIASQEAPGRNASYDYLVSGVKIALEWCDTYGISTLALPRIGSGIGGLDEHVVEAILTALAANSPVDIELWTYSR